MLAMRRSAGAVPRAVWIRDTAPPHGPPHRRGAACCARRPQADNSWLGIALWPSGPRAWQTAPLRCGGGGGCRSWVGGEHVHEELPEAVGVDGHGYLGVGV